MIAKPRIGNRLQLFLSKMGRRAKNKQGDPAPLDESRLLSKHTNSKRKADEESPERAPKKSKRSEDSQRVQTKNAANASKGKESKPQKSSKGGKKSKDNLENEEWFGIGGDEEVDLDAQRQ